MSVEVLLFGAHPDDVEWAIGGLSLLMRDSGVSFAMIDLSGGEMGSRGSGEERRQEASRAAEFLGAVARESLHLPDCGLIDNPDSRRLVASTIRRYRPGVVVAPFWEDRHPDHAAAGAIVRNSQLYCALRKLEDPNPPHKPERFYFYPLHHLEQPSILIDTSTVFQRKLELLQIHSSQFAKTAEDFGVLPLGFGDYMFALESRDRYFGFLAGVRFAEALITERPVFLRDLSGLPGLSACARRMDAGSEAG